MIRKVSSIVNSLLSSTYAIFITIAVWHILLIVFNIPLNYTVSGVIVIIDLLATYLLLDRLTYFFAQFVLPIQNKKDRHKIYVRVRDFNSGKRGPAIFIKNGQIIKQKNELERKGPGVVILDTASATVLRTDSEFRDTVGPGVKFTEVYKVDDEKFNEYPEESVDLRTQWKFIGPMANDNPFINPAQYPKEYSATHERREKTNSWTRDGFEISATISIKFRIKRYKNVKTESGVTSQYQYDPTYVRRAIIYNPLELKKTNNLREVMEWDKLPEQIVIDLWREYVRQFKLDEIFYNKEGIGGLQKIEDMINERVQEPRHTSPLRDKADISKEVSLEYKHLVERGIEIIDVLIHNVVLRDPEIEKNMVELWTSDWLNLEKEKENLLRKEKDAIEALVPQKASQKFALMVSQKYKKPITDDTRYVTLENLIEPVKDFLYRESLSNKEVEEILIKINSIWIWILSLKKKS